MRIYFKPDGSPNLKTLTAATILILIPYVRNVWYNIKPVNDDSMNPFFRTGGQFLRDRVLYKQFVYPDEDLKGKIVAILNPYKKNEIIFRRVIGEQGQWIERMDDGGFIKIPNNHIWIESLNQDERGVDSLSTFGPISKNYVRGQAKYVVWPQWRIESVRDLDKFKQLSKYEYKHSKVYTDWQMEQMYGIKS